MVVVARVLLFVAASVLIAAPPPQPKGPAYTAETILPSGLGKPAPLAPGMLASIFGERLGPATACTGSADPQRRETPNPLRPNQTLVETQVFPNRLCDTEVRVGGVAAGLLYVSAGQINFKVPQAAPVEGFTEVQVSYKGQSGPAVRVDLSNSPHTDSAKQLADRIWIGLQAIQWEAPYQQPGQGSPSACASVAPHTDLRFGLYGYVYYCRRPLKDALAEFFYYPADRTTALLLRRADFRLSAAYPEMSVEVERLLREHLTRAYGPGTVPDGLFEIGAYRPNPGLSWRAGNVTIFLHRNRNYVAPAGVRQGVLLIAVHQEVLREREFKRQLDERMGSSSRLARSAVSEDLKNALGALYPGPGTRPASEAERLKAERDTREALVRLLREAGQGEPVRRAAILFAADDLAVRLGGLLVARSYGSGGEMLSEAPGAGRVRTQLASYGVTYAGIGHYSGDLEYDRSLLRRAWKEFPGTPWGQRAFLILQSMICADPRPDCDGPSCFQTVIQRGEKFLSQYPETPFRKEQIYHLALAYDTWWSLSQADKGDPTAMGVEVDKKSAEAARKRAIELYEELLRIAPGSAEAQSGTLRLPRLKLGLSTGERAFFCFSC